MIRTLDLRGRALTQAELVELIPRARSHRDDALRVAHDLVAAVATEGEGALRAQAQRFDGVTEYDVRVPAEHRRQALEDLSPQLRTALQQAIARVRTASQAQIPQATATEFGSGQRVEQRWQPVARAGVYIPGGKAVYPSSVVMNVVPAQVAGVSEIALASPPQRDYGGRVHPVILAAAELLGVTEVYAMGGAGAIGAFAYGVPGAKLLPVDVITGPGNNFVAAAKHVVAGMVGIDAEAGATEIAIVADRTADARWVAADMISQAEHDEQAAAVLITPRPELAVAVQHELQKQAPQARHARRIQAALSGEQSAIVITDSDDQAVQLSNLYAPEHLEIQLADPRPERFVHAGAIFVGSYSPVSLGDYLAGSNHVLPTGGKARYSAGLSAATFLRPQQVIAYDRDGLDAVRADIVALSEAEQLPAHGQAVTARFSDDVHDHA